MKVLVVEDHLIVVSGCRALFAGDENVELHHAGCLKAAREAAAYIKPDIFVLDVNLPDGSGLEFAKELLAANSSAKIVIFTMSDAPILAVQVLELGALGYVSKNGDPMNLKQAIMAVFRGQALGANGTRPRDRVDAHKAERASSCAFRAPNADSASPGARQEHVGDRSRDRRLLQDGRVELRRDAQQTECAHVLRDGADRIAVAARLVEPAVSS